MLAQIGAEALGVPFETVRVDTGDTDTGPHCMGTFASRATHRAGNAIVRAADEAKRALLEVAAEEMEASPDDLETDGEGNVRVIGSPGSSMTVQDVALAAHFKHGKTISGRGMYMKPKSEVVPETGEMDPTRPRRTPARWPTWRSTPRRGSCACCAWPSAYEIGCAINPELVQGQIRGGAWMGMSHALYETTAPYYPSVDRRPGDLDLPDAGAHGSARDRGGGPGDASSNGPTA